MGDECLRQVARAMAGALERPSDLVARYGGEEFSCILPETDPLGALPVAKRIQARLAGLAIPHQSSAVSSVVTLSIGIATVVPTQTGDGLSLINAADLALYEAKRAGRDRIMAAGN